MEVTVHREKNSLIKCDQVDDCDRHVEARTHSSSRVSEDFLEKLMPESSRMSTGWAGKGLWEGTDGMCGRWRRPGMI